MFINNWITQYNMNTHRKMHLGFFAILYKGKIKPGVSVGGLRLQIGDFSQREPVSIPAGVATYISRTFDLIIVKELFKVTVDIRTVFFASYFLPLRC